MARHRNVTRPPPARNAALLGTDQEVAAMDPEYLRDWLFPLVGVLTLLTMTLMAGG